MLHINNTDIRNVHEISFHNKHKILMLHINVTHTYIILIKSRFIITCHDTPTLVLHISIT